MEETLFLYIAELDWEKAKKMYESDWAVQSSSE